MVNFQSLNLKISSGSKYGAGDLSKSSGGFLNIVSENNKEVKYGTYFTCRETFSGHFKTGTKSIVFATKNQAETMNLAVFMSLVDSMLGLKEVTAIINTSFTNLVKIEVPEWWSKYYHRRQLFTVLLRCGVNYVNNFKKALSSIEYANGTKAAIKSFLSGNTYLNKSHTSSMVEANGWYNYFNGNSGNVKNLLSKDIFNSKK